MNIRLDFLKFSFCFDQETKEAEIDWKEGLRIWVYDDPSLSGGKSQREPPNMGKQLVNFINCDCESSTPFLTT
jgi:hypothetical protein